MSYDLIGPLVLCGGSGLSDRTVASPLSAAKERDDGSTQQQLLLAKQRTEREPASLDDVLNSLLGLAPPPMHGPLRRPVSQPTIHNKQAHHQQQDEQRREGQQQPYQRQHQQQMCGNNNNNISPSLVIQEARSYNDLRSSTYTSSSSNK